MGSDLETARSVIYEELEHYNLSKKEKFVCSEGRLKNFEKSFREVEKIMKDRYWEGSNHKHRICLDYHKTIAAVILSMLKEGVISCSGWQRGSPYDNKINGEFALQVAWSLLIRYQCNEVVEEYEKVKGEGSAGAFIKKVQENYRYKMVLPGHINDTMPSVSESLANYLGSYSTTVKQDSVPSVYVKNETVWILAYLIFMIDEYSRREIIAYAETCARQPLTVAPKM